MTTTNQNTKVETMTEYDQEIAFVSDGDFTELAVYLDVDGQAYICDRNGTPYYPGEQGFDELKARWDELSMFCFDDMT